MPGKGKKGKGNQHSKTQVITVVEARDRLQAAKAEAEREGVMVSQAEVRGKLAALTSEMDTRRNKFDTPLKRFMGNLASSHGARHDFEEDELQAFGKFVRELQEIGVLDLREPQAANLRDKIDDIDVHGTKQGLLGRFVRGARVSSHSKFLTLFEQAVENGLLQRALKAYDKTPEGGRKKQAVGRKVFYRKKVAEAEERVAKAALIAEAAAPARAAEVAAAAPPVPAPAVAPRSTPLAAGSGSSVVEAPTAAASAPMAAASAPMAAAGSPAAAAPPAPTPAAVAARSASPTAGASAAPPLADTGEVRARSGSPAAASTREGASSSAAAAPPAAGEVAAAPTTAVPLVTAPSREVGRDAVAARSALPAAGASAAPPVADTGEVRARASSPAAAGLPAATPTPEVAGASAAPSSAPVPSAAGGEALHAATDTIASAPAQATEVTAAPGSTPSAAGVDSQAAAGDSASAPTPAVAPGSTPSATGAGSPVAAATPEVVSARRDGEAPPAAQASATVPPAAGGEALHAATDTIASAPAQATEATAAARSTPSAARVDSPASEEDVRAAATAYADQAERIAILNKIIHDSKFSSKARTAAREELYGKILKNLSDSEDIRANIIEHIADSHLVASDKISEEAGLLEAAERAGEAAAVSSRAATASPAAPMAAAGSSAAASTREGAGSPVAASARRDGEAPSAAPTALPAAAAPPSPTTAPDTGEVRARSGSPEATAAAPPEEVLVVRGRGSAAPGSTPSVTGAGSSVAAAGDSAAPSSAPVPAAAAPGTSAAGAGSSVPASARRDGAAPTASSAAAARSASSAAGAAVTGALAGLSRRDMPGVLALAAMMSARQKAADGQPPELSSPAAGVGSATAKGDVRVGSPAADGPAPTPLPSSPPGRGARSAALPGSDGQSPELSSPAAGSPAAGAASPQGTAAAVSGTGSSTPAAGPRGTATSSVSGLSAMAAMTKEEAAARGGAVASGPIYSRIMREAVEFYKKLDKIDAGQTVSDEDKARFGEVPMPLAFSQNSDEYEEKLKKGLEKPSWKPKVDNEIDKVIQKRREKVNLAIHNAVVEKSPQLQTDGDKESITFPSGAKIVATVNKVEGVVTDLKPSPPDNGREPEKFMTLTFPRVDTNGTPMSGKYDTLEYTYDDLTGEYKCTGATILEGFGTSKLSEELISRIDREVSASQGFSSTKSRASSGMHAASAVEEQARELVRGVPLAPAGSTAFSPPSTPGSGKQGKGGGVSR